MKVLHLQLEGFTCYRKKTEIDFSDLDLFAITGPTGSGKSSLVDAIIFALYGKTPRMGSDLSGLISQGLKKMSVLLVFTSGGISYKVGRYMQSGRSSQAILDIKEDDWCGLASGVRQVNQKILKILGVDYDTFTRCIVLPQGAFAQFLQDAGERQDILINLLGLEMLVEMQKSASRENEQAKEKIQQLECRLGQEFEDVSLERARGLKEEYDGLESKLKVRQGQIQDLSDKLRQLREAVLLQELLKNLEQEYSSVLPQQKEMEKLRAKIDIARRILPLVPQIEQFEAVQKRWREAQARGNWFLEQEQTLLLTREKIEILLEKAQKDMGGLTALDRQCEKLQEVRQIAGQLKSRTEELRKDTETYREKRRRFEESQRQMEETRAGIGNLRKQKEICDGKLREFEIQHKVFQKFQGAENLLQLLAENRDIHRKSSQKLEQSLKALEQRKKQWQKILVDFGRQETRVHNLQEQLKEREGKKELEKELLKLEEAYHLQERMKEQQSECGKEESRLAQEQKSHKETSAAVALAREGLSAMESRIKEIAAGQKEKEAVYRQAQDLLRDHERLSQQSRSHRQDLTGLEKRQHSVSRAIQELTAAIQELTARKEAVKGELEDARNRWMQAYTDDLSCSLRRHIKPGDRCPVCRQTVKKLPPEPKASDIAVGQLQAEVEQKQALLDEVEKKLTESETMLASTGDAARELDGQLAKKRRELEEAEGALKEPAARLTNLLDSPNYQTVLVKFGEALAQSAQEQEHLQHLIFEKQSFIREQEFSLGTWERMRKEREKSIDSYRKAMAELAEKIEALVGKTDILRQRQETKAKLEQLAEIEKELAKVEKTFLNLSWHKDAEERQLKEEEKAVEDCRQQADETLATLRSKQDVVRQQLGLEVENIEMAIADGVKRYQDLCRHMKEQAEEQSRMAQELNKLEIAEAAQEAAVREISQSLLAMETRLQELSEHNQKMEREIHKVTKGEDADALLQKLKEKKREIEGRYQKFREEGLIVEQQLKSNGQEKESVEKLRADLEVEIEGFKSTLGQALADLELSSIEELLKMKIAPDALRQWENKLVAEELRIRQLKAKIEECRGKLQNRSVAPGELEEVAGSLKKAEELQASHLKRQGEIARELQHLEKQLAQVERVQKDLQDTLSGAGVYQQLAKDLRANQFPSYVLEHALNALAEDAGSHLDFLTSGRYAFALDKREFCVVDHWNEGERRPSKTLSGGETFVAALALAMALADRVYQLGSRMGGSAALESLFIDEGFGSLDEEHLDIVVKALNNLQGTGRTIGVISHLTLLNNYLPARLVVHKDREGSTIQREQT